MPHPSDFESNASRRRSLRIGALATVLGALAFFLGGCGGGGDGLRGLADRAAGLVGIDIPCEPECDVLFPAAGETVTGDVQITVEVTDPEGDPASLTVFFSIGGGGLNLATLTSTSDGDLDEPQGCDPDNPGGDGVTGIKTNSGANTVTVTWDSVGDGVGLVGADDVTLTAFVEDCSTVLIGGNYNPPCTVDVFVLNNGEPTGEVTAPVAGAQVAGTGVVPIDYDTQDPDSNTLECTFEWSSDGGTTWNLATAAAGSTNPMTGAPGPGTFLWEAPADIPAAAMPLDVQVSKAIDDLSGRPTLPFALSGVFTLVAVTEPTCALVSPASGTCIDTWPTGTIDLTLDVTDAGGDPIRLSVCFSAGAGVQPATLTAASAGMLAGFGPDQPTACAGVANQVMGLTSGMVTLTWDVLADGLGSMMCDAVTVIVYPEDGTTLGAGPYSTCDLDLLVASSGTPSCAVATVTQSTVTFDVTDADSPMVSAQFDFSTDGGTTWQAKTPAMGTTNPAMVAPGLGLTWGWDAAADLGGCTMGLLCRVSVDDGVMLPNRPATCTGLPVDLLCVPVLTNCRTLGALTALGSAVARPTGVVPAYVAGAGGAPPATGNIGDNNPNSVDYWDFDYLGVNEGEFDTVAQLTDAGGNNVGNPVVLFSAGHDYTAIDVDPVGPCNAVDQFQMILEGDVGGALMDLAPMTTPFMGATLTTTWTTSEPSAVDVSVDGLLTAVSENQCATISWSLASSDPMVITVDPGCTGGSFVACVDSAGIDTATRATWLPVGDIDANIGGLPSGRPIGGVGSPTTVTWIVNSGTNGVGAYAVRTEYDEAFIEEDTATDTMSIGGSTQASLGDPFAVNTSVPNETRWSDVDAFATTMGIFDLSTQTFLTIGSGTTQLALQNEELADGAACNIWVTNPCMPYNSFVCPMPPPAGGYSTIAGSAQVDVP